MGDDSSTRRPTAATIFSITWRYWSSSVNEAPVWCSLPSRSIQMSS